MAGDLEFLKAYLADLVKKPQMPKQDKILIAFYRANIPGLISHTTELSGLPEQKVVELRQKLEPIFQRNGLTFPQLPSDKK